MDKAIKLAFDLARKNGVQPIEILDTDNKTFGGLDTFDVNSSARRYYILTEDKYKELLQKAYDKK